VIKLQHVSKSQMEGPWGITDEHGVIEVDEAVAGHPPDPRIEELSALINTEPRLDHYEIVRLTNEVVSLDRGSGLLAQDWKPFGTKAKAALKQEDDK
jgi:hypothetical protein